MATTSDLSRNSFLRYNNELVQVLDYDHITPGKGNAIYSVKCRNVETGKQSEVRYLLFQRFCILPNKLHFPYQELYDHSPLPEPIHYCVLKKYFLKYQKS